MAKQQSKTSKKTETGEEKEAPAKEAPAKEAPAKEAASTAPPPKDPAPAAAAKPAGGWRAKAPLALAFVGVGVGGILIGRFTTIPPAAILPPPSVPSASASAPAEFEAQKFDLEESPTNKLGQHLRPMDREIFDEIIAMRIDRKQMADVFPGKPYRVRFVGSVAEKHISLVMVDLNRDGSWDETWKLKPGTVERTVDHDPQAGNMPVMYTLAHGRWIPH